MGAYRSGLGEKASLSSSRLTITTNSIGQGKGNGVHVYYPYQIGLHNRDMVDITFSFSPEPFLSFT